MTRQGGRYTVLHNVRHGWLQKREDEMRCTKSGPKDHAGKPVRRLIDDTSSKNPIQTLLDRGRIGRLSLLLMETELTIPLKRELYGYLSGLVFPQHVSADDSNALLLIAARIRPAGGQEFEWEGALRQTPSRMASSPDTYTRGEQLRWLEQTRIDPGSASRRVVDECLQRLAQLNMGYVTTAAVHMLRFLRIAANAQLAASRHGIRVEHELVSSMDELARSLCQEYEDILTIDLDSDHLTVHAEDLGRFTFVRATLGPALPQLLQLRRYVVARTRSPS